jgi:hypothetical protein
MLYHKSAIFKSLEYSWEVCPLYFYAAESVQRSNVCIYLLVTNAD